MGQRAGTVQETPWWLDVNGARIATGSATPERIEALAAGRVLVDGYAAGPHEILALSVIYDPPGCVGVRVRVPPDRARAAETLRRHRVKHGCGARHYIECDPNALRARAETLEPPMDALPELFRELFASAERSRETGGVHTAALTDGAVLLHQIEEVGRHNAVDKTIGSAMLERAELQTLGLILSARVSAEIALKAVQAGIAWVASRSIPTDLAVELAERAALPIVARGASKERRLFAGRVPDASRESRDDAAAAPPNAH